MTAIAPTMQAFFTDRLMTQLHASPHTIASYRDTMRLLLAYASQQHGKEPCKLHFTDLGAPTIGAFLTHLETTRGNGVTTRNARLVAIRSLFRYASLLVPEHAGLISRVLAIPGKRHDGAVNLNWPQGDGAVWPQGHRVTAPACVEGRA